MFKLLFNRLGIWGFFLFILNCRMFKLLFSRLGVGGFFLIVFLGYK
jgi:hypothetical protein